MHYKLQKCKISDETQGNLAFLLIYWFPFKVNFLMWLKIGEGDVDKSTESKLCPYHINMEHEKLFLSYFDRDLKERGTEKFIQKYRTYSGCPWSFYIKIWSKFLSCNNTTIRWYVLANLHIQQGMWKFHFNFLKEKKEFIQEDNKLSILQQTRQEKTNTLRSK